LFGLSDLTYLSATINSGTGAVGLSMYTDSVESVAHNNWNQFSDSPWDAFAMAEGVTGGLRPFLEALAGDDERRDFERKVLDRYIAAYPRQPGGRLLFPFTRLFFVAYRRDPEVL
jgi:trans-aconitate methyltransferase